MVVKVRKPIPIKFFGLGNAYNRYTNRWYKWNSLLPNNGDKIQITWFPPCINGRGQTNPYIGFEGIVQDMNKIEGSFCIFSGSAVLVVTSGNFDYIKL